MVYNELNYLKIKGQLVENGKTIEDLANFIGIRRESLNLKLLGKTKLTLEEYIKIVNFFGKSLDFFLKSSDNN